MADDDPGNNGTDDSGTPPVITPPPPPSGSSFTQDQVTQIATREADKARRSATKGVLEELGFTSKEEAAKFVQAAKDAELANMTEAERIKAEAETVKAAAEAERASIARERHQLTVKEALIEAGAPLDKATRMVSMVEAETGADAATVKTAVETLKTEFPAMFGGPTGPVTPPSSNPASGGAPGKRTAQAPPMDAGRERAKAFLASTQRPDPTGAFKP